MVIPWVKELGTFIPWFSLECHSPNGALYISPTNAFNSCWCGATQNVSLIWCTILFIISLYPSLSIIIRYYYYQHFGSFITLDYEAHRTLMDPTAVRCYAQQYCGDDCFDGGLRSGSKSYGSRAEQIYNHKSI
eukprot:183201_1